MVTLAAGAGSRWTQGAGVVKALHPFCEARRRPPHLPRGAPGQEPPRRRACAAPPCPHVVTTSYLTHDADRGVPRRARARVRLRGPAATCRRAGRSACGWCPMARDLRFAWEEMPQQVLDEQAQKVRESLRRRADRLGPARRRGQRLHRQPAAAVPAPGRPLVRGAEPAAQRRAARGCSPSGRGLQVPDAAQHRHAGRGRRPGAARAAHSSPGACLTFEVIARRIEDRGGGLARVDGRVRLVEGLAMPREEDEFDLSYYNSMTTWIDIDRLLAAFGLTRGDLDDEAAGRRGGARPGGADADLHHAQGREEALGPRPGGRLPGGPVREALGRHDRAAGRRLRASSWSRACAASSSRSRRSSTAGCATARPRTSRRDAHSPADGQYS